MLVSSRRIIIKANSQKPNYQPLQKRLHSKIKDRCLFVPHLQDILKKYYDAITSREWAIKPNFTYAHSETFFEVF